MNMKPALSLCIPTNGIIEWVFPVLNSIYSENCNTDEFEVIVTDNGNNKSFEDAMGDYAREHSNLIYKKTNAIMFENQIEAFKMASGDLIKFINHRMKLLPGTVNYFVGFAKKYQITMPPVYFSNGVLHMKQKVKECHCFDEYVRTLSYWSSWSAGTAIWKKAFDQIDLSTKFNTLFPHTDIVFSEKNEELYVVDNTKLMEELPTDNIKKGNYDLFYAFAVEYPSIVENLMIAGYISKDTFKNVKQRNGYFVSELYLNYVIKKKPCSYNLDGFATSIGKYYNRIETYIYAMIIEIKNIIKRFIGRIIYYGI